MLIHNGETSGERTLAEDGHSVSYSDLSDIIRMRVEELLRLIVLELPRSDYARFIPSGIVLTGGTANLPGIAELAQEVTRLPVRVGVPISLYGVSDVLSNPAYATSVGLLLWQLKNKDKQSWRPQGGLRRFVTRILGLFR